jgi:hypothetical protein
MDVKEEVVLHEDLLYPDQVLESRVYFGHSCILGNLDDVDCIELEEGLPSLCS